MRSTAVEIRFASAWEGVPCESDLGRNSATHSRTLPKKQRLLRALLVGGQGLEGIGRNPHTGCKEAIDIGQQTAVDCHQCLFKDCNDAAALLTQHDPSMWRWGIMAASSLGRHGTYAALALCIWSWQATSNAEVRNKVAVEEKSCSWKS